MMKTKIFIAAMFLAACGEEDKSLSVDETFSSKEFALIQDAVGQWSEACDCEEAQITVTHDYVSPDGIFTEDDFKNEQGVLFFAETTDPGYQQIVDILDTLKGGAAEFLGVANYPMGNVAVIMDRIPSPELLNSVLVHEVGHLHGLQHLGSGIMSIEAITHELGCVDQLALDTLCEEYDCGGGAHSTCE
jgi:hypothetical protein